MKLALAQMRMSEAPEENLAASLDFIDRAAKNGAGLVIFPELQFTKFFPQYPNLDVSSVAYAFDHPFVKQLQERCKQHRIAAVPNFYLSENGKYFDASVVIDRDGKILGASKMVHIVRAPLFYELDYYTPSDTGFKVYDTAIGKIGVVVCFDRHFPESIRKCVKDGAELIVIATANTRAEPMELFEWEMRVAAYQNGVFIAMCNRVGQEGEMDFCGESLLCGPDGSLIAKAGGGDTLLVQDIDLSAAHAQRKKLPYLSLLRNECY